MADSSFRFSRGKKALYGMGQHSNADDGPSSTRMVTRAPNRETKEHGVSRGGETGRPVKVSGRDDD